MIWKILGLEIAPQLVGKYIIPGDPYRFPKILADGLKGDFSSSSMMRNFGMDFLGWRNVVVCFEIFLSCQS